MQPTRETFGNIPRTSQVIFYVLTFVALGIFAYGVWRRYRLWSRGASAPPGKLLYQNLCTRWQTLQPRLKRFFAESLGQKRVRGRGLPSWAHGLLFTGFMILFLGTTLLEVDHLSSWLSESLHFHKGTYYLVYEFTLDVFGVLFLVGCILFFWRRARRPESVGHQATDWYVLLAFLAIGVTGYVTEGLRIAWQHPVGIAARCSPVGLFVAQLFSGFDDHTARAAHLGVWWAHAILVFGFIASIPYTRLLHMLTGPLNLFLAAPVLGTLKPVTLEEVEKLERVGVSSIAHFDGQQLLSLDACMECGRCQDACPAYATGKPLSPKRVVQDLDRLMGLQFTGKQNGPAPAALHGETISAETLWSCTTCSACVGICPVRVDPLTLITDLRRHLVGEGSLSGTAATALRRMQSSANPWGLPPADRANWAENLGAPTVRENASFELLYWVGCAGSYDRRAQRVAAAVVKLLKHARVNFAILGREEKCTGESARRLGDEFLFQELAQANIETLAKYKVCKIVAHCPHCLNSLLKDYSQFGGHYEVIHHTQLIAQLIDQGRLKLPEDAPIGTVTYHDPCYLARVNGIHREPRLVIQQLLTGPNNSFVEMRRAREKTFCCGAGGGRMWMEEDPKKRVSTLRAKEAVGTGAKTVAVGCPFCLTMMTDGVAANESDAKVLDIAELLAQRLKL